MCVFSVNSGKMKYNDYLHKKNIQKILAYCFKIIYTLLKFIASFSISLIRFQNVILIIIDRLFNLSVFRRRDE